MASPYSSEPPPEPPGSPPPEAAGWAPPSQAMPASASSPTPPADPPLQGYAVPQNWSGRAWPGLRQAPASVTIAAVLTYIQAALGLMGSVVLLVAGPVLAGPRAVDVLGPYLVLTLVVAIGRSVLYIAAAVQLQRGRSRAFLLWLTVVSIALEVASAAASVALAGGRTPGGSSNLCSLVLPVIVLVLVLQPSTAQWIESRRGGPYLPGN